MGLKTNATKCMTRWQQQTRADDGKVLFCISNTIAAEGALWCIQGLEGGLMAPTEATTSSRESDTLWPLKAPACNIVYINS